ncbi:MAG: PDZ domain-containing protein [Planctomycetota bacterium]
MNKILYSLVLIFFATLLLSLVAHAQVDDEQKYSLYNFAYSNSQDGWSQYSLQVRKGPEDELTVILNGTRVPDERILREGDRIDIQDEEGKTIFSFDMTTSGLSFPSGLTLDGSQWLGQQKPRSMVGVRTQGLGADLAAQLRLDPETAILVAEVIEGMPAEHAGLHKYDVITHVDGVASVSQKSFRDAVAAKKEGDTVELRVIRGGDSRTISIAVKEVKSAYSLDSIKGLQSLYKKWPSTANRYFDMGQFLKLQKLRNQQGWYRRDLFLPELQGLPRSRGLEDEAALERRMKSLEDQLQRLETLLEELKDRRL